MNISICCKTIPRLAKSCTLLNVKSLYKPHMAMLSFKRTLNQRFYSKQHEWLQLENNVAKVGITNYAQDVLGDVVFVQLPQVDQIYEKEEEVGTVESVKAASEVYTPVSGKVTDVNTKLESTPALLNKSCYEEGWIFKIEISNKEELKELMCEEDYNAFLSSMNPSE